MIKSADGSKLSINDMRAEDRVALLRKLAECPGTITDATLDAPGVMTVTLKIKVTP